MQNRYEVKKLRAGEKLLERIGDCPSVQRFIGKYGKPLSRTTALFHLQRYLSWLRSDKGVAKSPDETMEEWDPPSPAVGRLGEVDSHRDPQDPRYGDFCLFARVCQDCKDNETEGSTYLRDGKLVSVCEKHTQPGDLKLRIEEARTRMVGLKETAATRHERIRELHARKLSSRAIARELNISQGAVAYHLARQKQEHNLAKKAE